LATFTMKTDARSGPKAFVTLRFAGDDLDPQEISAVLPITPTRAHRKGEEFVAGQHAGTLRGRTGIWFLATDKLVHSDNLADHLAFVHGLLYPEPSDVSRITRLGDILGHTHARAHITCFWHGNPGETAPQIPDRFKSAIEPLAADVETDFEAGSSGKFRRREMGLLIMLTNDDGRVYTGNTEADLVSRLHSSSYSPGVTDGDFMRETANRVRLQTGKRVRHNTPENFITDLVKAGVINLATEGGRLVP
jgi:hypothetical protein